MKQPYSHFDLPKQHLSGEHYFPARSRDPREIERRRALAPGTLLAEQQATGVRMTARMFEAVSESPVNDFALELLAASGLNSSWYTFADKQHEVMRRRLYLPRLADDETEERVVTTERVIKVRSGLLATIENADRLTYRAGMNRLTKRGRAEFGRSMGTVSLGLASIQLGNGLLHNDAFIVQDMMRNQALQTLDASRRLERFIGVAPSVAQLADPDSPLSVYWRRHAPDEVYGAYEQAYEETIAA
jgi:hypothetical protein